MKNAISLPSAFGVGWFSCIAFGVMRGSVFGNTQVYGQNKLKRQVFLKLPACIYEKSICLLRRLGAELARCHSGDKEGMLALAVTFYCEWVAVLKYAIFGLC